MAQAVVILVGLEVIKVQPVKQHVTPAPQEHIQMRVQLPAPTAQNGTLNVQPATKTGARRAQKATKLTEPVALEIEWIKHIVTVWALI